MWKRSITNVFEKKKILNMNWIDCDLYRQHNRWSQKGIKRGSHCYCCFSAVKSIYVVISPHSNAFPVAAYSLKGCMLWGISKISLNWCCKLVRMTDENDFTFLEDKNCSVFTATDIARWLDICRLFNNKRQ